MKYCGLLRTTPAGCLFSSAALLPPPAASESSRPELPPESSCLPPPPPVAAPGIPMVMLGSATLVSRMLVSLGKDFFRVFKSEKVSSPGLGVEVAPTVADVTWPLSLTGGKATDSSAVLDAVIEHSSIYDTQICGHVGSMNWFYLHSRNQTIKHVLDCL